MGERPGVMILGTSGCPFAGRCYGRPPHSRHCPSHEGSPQMTKLFLRAALAGCATAGLAGAQTPPPPPIAVAPPTPPQHQLTNLPAAQTPAFPPVAVPPPVPVQGPVLTYRAVSPTQAKMVLKTFDVADLVCPPADSPLAKPGTDPAMIAAAKAFAEVRGAELLKLVRADDAFHFWGMMEFTTDGKTLVVNCPELVVDKIADRLSAVRTARRAMVKVDMTVFTVPSGNEAVVKLLGDKMTAPVTAGEMTRLMRDLKTSGAVDILTRPTMLMQNKQTGVCQTGQLLPVTGCPTACETVGITSRVTPELSADLRSVLLALELQHTQPACGSPGVSCVQSKANVVVPDGGSMAVKVGTQKVERRIESKVPVVSDIPYMGRLFRSVSSTTEPTDVVAVVTATRLADAPCVAPPMAAPVPPMMPTAVPFSTPLAAPTPVMLPLPGRADGLDRVGVGFNALTNPPALPPTPAWVAPPARTGFMLTRMAPSETVVCGGVIGATVNGDDTAELMAAYKAACAAGRSDDATRLALKLLAKDPTCFGK